MWGGPIVFRGNYFIQIRGHSLIIREDSIFHPVTDLLGGISISKGVQRHIDNSWDEVILQGQDIVILS